MRALLVTFLTALALGAAARPALALPPNLPHGLVPPEARVVDTGPSEPGRIVAETAAAFGALGLTVGLTVAVVGVPVVAPGVFVLGPLAAGGVVCAIGSGSKLYESRCRRAIIGAYIGGLLTLPLAYVGYEMGTPDDGEFGKGGAAVVAGVIGFVVGGTIGAVVGWNSGRTPKAHVDVDEDPAPIDVARLDALATARMAVWREPPRHRGPAPAEPTLQLGVPLLAFRF